MNFFKSILSDDPDPPSAGKIHDSGPNSPHNAADGSDSDETPDAKPNPPSSSADSGSNSASTAASSVSVGGWSFGGLVRTLATRSESVIETYRRDLQEFGTGLRKETGLFREVASRAVKDLPASIEVGASAAHGSLESVSHAIDGVIKSTTVIISQGIETAAISHTDVDPDTPDTGKRLSLGRYSRFDAQLNAIQSDMNTFCEEPEDSEDYKNWKSGWVLAENGEEIETLIGENGVLEGVYSKVVPNVVDNETFWCRYFYRVHKLKLQESFRANLVKRAISVDDEEEFSWDVDDDEDDSLEKKVESKGDELENRALPVAKPDTTSAEPQSSSFATANDSAAIEHVDKADKAVQSNVVSPPEEKAKIEKHVEKVVEDEEKPASSNAAKVDQGESGKDSDISVVSSQQSVHEEQDLEWDEIEDIGSGDEKRANLVTQGGSPNRADVRKRLSTAEEDEDLTWDIEDED